MQSKLPPYQPPKTLRELTNLIAKSNVNIESFFKRLHHFSQPQFKSKPVSFEQFKDWCERRPVGIKPDGENEQAIQRTYFFLELLLTPPAEAAIAEAWNVFPLVTRPHPNPLPQGEGVKNTYR